MLLSGDRSVDGLLPQLAGGGGARVGRSGTLRVTEGVPPGGAVSLRVPGSLPVWGSFEQAARRFAGDCARRSGRLGRGRGRYVTPLTLSSPMPSTNELRVFVSSTFRDLQEEREHLIKKVFPEIRAICRGRGVTFTEVDLRWGLTEQDAMLGHVIRTCLEEVDRCRPYFIGIIGNRYGWVPEFHEILMDPELLQKYPWIEEIALEGASVTEMEFIHGVFDSSPADGEYAFFYHRQDGDGEVDDPERLAELIDRARSTGHPFQNFESVESLGEMVRHDLVTMIDHYWPVNDAPSPLELERRAHAAFSASRTRAYIPNPLYLKEFSRWVAEGERPLVVRGASGLGKSSLVAYLTDSYRKKNRDALVIEHYVGASDTSGSATAIMRHVVEEIRERFAIDDELPKSEAELEKAFPGWLFRAEQLAAESETPVLIILDAVNQLGERGRLLNWLPKKMPARIKVVITTTPGETDDRLLEREWDQIEVTPLEDERIRQSIVVRYLGEFKKGVTPDQLRKLAGGENSSSPLFLRVVAEELRLHGEHETLDKQIDRFMEMESLLELFDEVLERIERDYGESETRDLLAFIALSRTGLSEREILELTGMPRLTLSRLLFALDYHLVRNNGHLGFFHSYLSRAVDRRYLSDSHARTSRLQHLADHFRRATLHATEQGEPVEARDAKELLAALEELGKAESLAEELSRIDITLSLVKAGESSLLLRYWPEFKEEAKPGERYLESLKKWRAETEKREDDIVARRVISVLLQSLGDWDTSIALLRGCIDDLDSTVGLTVRGSIHSVLGSYLTLRGDLDEAGEHLEKSVALLEQSGEQLHAAQSRANLGGIYSRRGEHDRALECFRSHVEECRANGAEISIGAASSLATMGIEYTRLGKDEKALACFQEAVAIHHARGDRLGAANPTRLIANTYGRLGRLDEAEKILREAESTCRAFSDYWNLAFVLYNLGTLKEDRGELEDGLRIFRDGEQISRELGDRPTLERFLLVSGEMEATLGNFTKGLEAVRESEEISRELGNISLDANRVSLKGRIHLLAGDPVTAYRELHAGTGPLRELRGGVKDRLTYVAAVDSLLQIVETMNGPPLSLTDLLGTLSDDNWRELLTKRARSLFDEAVHYTTSENNTYTLAQETAMTARLEFAEGKKEAAEQRLLELLEKAESDSERAEMHYTLSKLSLGSNPEEHRVEALELYRALREVSEMYMYAMRMEELEGK